MNAPTSESDIVASPSMGTKRSFQQRNGHLGGVLAGKLGYNRYVTDYAKDGRSKCRHTRCKVTIRKGEFRVGKIAPALKTGHATRTQWYHPECIFKSFGRMTKQTKTIDSVKDIEDYERLDQVDQEKLLKICIEHTESAESQPEPLKASEATANAATSKPSGKSSLSRVPTDDTLAEPDEVMRSQLQLCSRPSYPQFSLYSCDAAEIADKIRSIGSSFESIAEKVVQCGLDGRYIMTRTVTQFDEMFHDLGLDDHTQNGRQKRRRICFELGLYK